MSIKINFGEETEEITIEPLSVMSSSKSNEPTDAMIFLQSALTGEVSTATTEEI